MIDRSGILEQTKEFVLAQMAKNDAAHDGAHVFRVVCLAKQLCGAYPQADSFRVELLSWLHDVNDDKLLSNVGQASLADFLQSIGTPQEDAQFVIQALPYIP